MLVPLTLENDPPKNIKKLAPDLLSCMYCWVRWLPCSPPFGNKLCVVFPNLWLMLAGFELDLNRAAAIALYVTDETWLSKHIFNVCFSNTCQSNVASIPDFLHCLPQITKTGLKKLLWNPFFPFILEVQISLSGVSQSKQEACTLNHLLFVGTPQKVVFLSHISDQWLIETWMCCCCVFHQHFYGTVGKLVKGCLCNIWKRSV